MGSAFSDTNPLQFSKINQLLFTFFFVSSCVNGIQQNKSSNYQRELYTSLGFALIYRNDYVTYISKNELWQDESNSSGDCNGDYLNCKLYMFAGRPPMETYLSWTDGTKTINLYTINVH